MPPSYRRHHLSLLSLIAFSSLGGLQACGGSSGGNNINNNNNNNNNGNNQTLEQDSYLSEPLDIFIPASLISANAKTEISIVLTATKNGKTITSEQKISIDPSLNVVDPNIQSGENPVVPSKTTIKLYKINDTIIYSNSIPSAPLIKNKNNDALLKIVVGGEQDSLVTVALKDSDQIIGSTTLSKPFASLDSPSLADTDNLPQDIKIPFTRDGNEWILKDINPLPYTLTSLSFKDNSGLIVKGTPLNWSLSLKDQSIVLNPINSKLSSLELIAVTLSSPDQKHISILRNNPPLQEYNDNEDSSPVGINLNEINDYLL